MSPDLRTDDELIQRAMGGGMSREAAVAKVRAYRASTAAVRPAAAPLPPKATNAAQKGDAGSPPKGGPKGTSTHRAVVAANPTPSDAPPAPADFMPGAPLRVWGGPGSAPRDVMPEDVGAGTVPPGVMGEVHRQESQQLHDADAYLLDQGFSRAALATLSPEDRVLVAGQHRKEQAIASQRPPV